jgi:PLP dependent protein
LTVETNFNEVKARIASACERANRNSNEVEVIAVTKYVSLATAKKAVEAGVQHLGENRIEGFSEKQNALGNKATMHFIGTLQSRKVKEVINDVDYLHSLDRLSLAKEIDKRAEKTIKCFVQVNVSGEQSKHGLVPEEVLNFVQELQQYPSIEVVGLMTMAPNSEDQERIREVFKSLKKLQQKVQLANLAHAKCEHLSMGMSNDFEIAIEEGATFIRVGSALVGNETK